MGKLSAPLIGEYFAVQLPYRTRILLAHHRMTRAPWHGDRAQLEAAFEASLITGRMYLNVVGVSKNCQDVLVPRQPQIGDVSAIDLGGTFVDIGALTPDDVALLTRFLKMADKGAAHLTMPMPHPVGPALFPAQNKPTCLPAGWFHPLRRSGIMVTRRLFGFGARAFMMMVAGEGLEPP